MKIEKINSYMLKKELSSGMQISRGGFKTRYHCIIEVVTDQGITGLGEGIGNANYVQGLMNTGFADGIIGMDAFQVELIRKSLLDSKVYFERKGSAICAASAIEMALIDIKAKALGIPAYELLGGKCQSELDMYASNVYWEESPLDMAKQVESIKSKGIHKIKAHIGFKSPKEELERVKALRDATGDSDLMIDLNCGYTFTEALSAARLWEPYDLYWLEEPLNPNSVARMGELKSKSNIPIASGENEFCSYGFLDLFKNNAVDVCMPDLGRAGGVIETKNICAMAEAFGVEVSPHNYSSGVLLAATIHTMASTINATLLEYDASDNAVYHEFFDTPLKVSNGKLEVPSSAGFGVSLTKEILEKYAV